MHTSVSIKEIKVTDLQVAKEEIHAEKRQVSLEKWQKELCKAEAKVVPEGSEMLDLLMLSRDITPNASDYNVFLGETACNSRPLYRAWCSVESFAYQNPTAKVWYLITAPQVDDSDALVTALRRRYGNLKVVGADLDRMFAGTPVEEIFRSGRWAHNTPWPANNLSNLLRNVVLWLWGGINADTDCMCVSNVTHLRNVVAYDEVEKVANNAIMHFDARHPFVYESMSYLKKNFKVATWHVNGPGVATNIAKKLCKTQNLNHILHQQCSSVKLMPLKNMQIFRWPDWKKIFEIEKGKQFLQEHKEAYILHMYNKLSKKNPVEIGSRSIYDIVAEVSCPVTYDAAKRRSYFF
ncbi:lactosylceramide 4-alpha-galactosyltransferase-like [Penaeus japonicus]|uniref:lactosylceramide 4-alpha-galactosyltransferase-like n=1 Tax=Penaeus japonicus TaxID=27405 RepID=UPI001C713E77|nr:lactosylceramide 4-alpha-galactosyltransferase-like [Penaeus japonicus]